MKGPEYTVEDQPKEPCQDSGVVVLDDELCLPGFLIIASELFLASGAFISGREKAQRHFKGEYAPDDDHDDRLLIKNIDHGTARVEKMVSDKTDEHAQEQNGPVYKAEIVRIHDE